MPARKQDAIVCFQSGCLSNSGFAGGVDGATLCADIAGMVATMTEGEQGVCVGVSSSIKTDAWKSPSPALLLFIWNQMNFRRDAWQIHAVQNIGVFVSEHIR